MLTPNDIAAIRRRHDPDVIALLAEVDRLRAALEAVEWDVEGCCPWCIAWFREGHAPDCQRQAALGL